MSEIENKVSDHNHDKYITTPDFNILAARVFNARLAKANLVTTTNFDTKLQSLNKRSNSNKTKHLMQPILEAKIILMVMAIKII